MREREEFERCARAKARGTCTEITHRLGTKGMQGELAPNFVPPIMGGATRPAALFPKAIPQRACRDGPLHPGRLRQAKKKAASRDAAFEIRIRSPKLTPSPRPCAGGRSASRSFRRQGPP